MIYAVQIGVIAVFMAYVLLDCVSYLPRIAGSIVGSNAVGYSFNLIINSFKRIFAVLYPPMLGILSIYITTREIYNTIIVCYILSFPVVIIVYMLRIRIISTFACAIRDYTSSGRLFISIFRAISQIRMESPDSEVLVKSGALGGRMGRRIIWSGTVIFSAYSSSLFIINIIGSAYSQYGSIVYQLVGLVNGIGTILLAFYLDPMLSRFYESKGSLLGVTNSIFVAQTLSILIVGPFLVSIIYYILI